MSETTLTHKELGRMLGVSETTIKSYRRKFPDCIPVANEGKPIRFTQEAGKVCLHIRELFSRGMAVPEVRARLEKEFSWIGPAPAAEEASVVSAVEPAAPAGPVEVELPQDYTLAMSGLAKSMVNLSMKQDTIMRKMESIDARLKELGLHGLEPGKEPAGMPDEMIVWLERANSLIERMEQLSLRDEVRESDHDQVDKPHGKLVRIRNAYGDVNEYTVETESVPSSAAGSDRAAEYGRESGVASVSATDTGREAQAGETEPDNTVMTEEGSFTFDSEEPKVHAQAENTEVRAQHAQHGQHAQHAVQLEPPRALLTIPLVIQSPDGEFLGVAGRTRGRFCINDLKAMLMNHYEGIRRYSSHWQMTENGWLMTLEQKDSPDPHNLAMLVEKTTTPRGNDVSLIEHLTINGRDENPVEMYNFINKIYES